MGLLPQSKNLLYSPCQAIQLFYVCHFLGFNFIKRHIITPLGLSFDYTCILMQIRIVKNYKINTLIALLLTTSTLTLNSCRKVECEDFNVDHEVKRWHLFPEQESVYTFGNDSFELNMDLTNLTISEFEEYRCHMCACFRDFSSTYNADSLSINSFVGYNSINDKESPTVSYSINNKYIRFYLNSDNSIRIESNDGKPYNEDVKITLKKSAEINGKTFNQVLEIDILSQNQITRMWVEYGTGLVAFELNGQNLTKIE